MPGSKRVELGEMELEESVRVRESRELREGFEREFREGEQSLQWLGPVELYRELSNRSYHPNEVILHLEVPRKRELVDDQPSLPSLSLVSPAYVV